MASLKLVELRLREGRWSTQTGRLQYQEPLRLVDRQRRTWQLEYIAPHKTHWVACKPDDELVIGRKYRLRRGAEVRSFTEVLAKAAAVPEEGGKRA